MARSELLKRHQKADDGTSHSPKSKGRRVCPIKRMCVWGTGTGKHSTGRRYSAGVFGGSCHHTVDQHECAEPLMATDRPTPQRGSFQDLSLGQSFSCSLRSARGCEFSCVIALRGSVLSCCWRVISRHRTRFFTLAIRETQAKTAV